MRRHLSSMADVRRSQPPDAVVFDCDGLLLDTEECWTRAERRLFTHHGHAFTPELKRIMLGKAGQETAAILERSLDQPGRGEALRLELLELAMHEVAAGATPRAGAAELVAELRGSVPIAVASNSPRAILDTALECAGMSGALDVVLGGDEVPEPKPAPDIYAAACRLLGAEPGRSVALEDSPTGVAAARAAGLYVIGVPSLAGIVLEASLTARSLEDDSVRAALGLPAGARRGAAERGG